MIAVKDGCSTLAIQSLESVSRPFNQIMLSFLFPDSTQLTGTPPGPLWSFRRCRASRASSPASCPSPTSPLLKGSIVPMLQESCFSSPVSLVYLWKICETFIFGWIMTDTRTPSLSAFFVLLGMAIYTGVTVHFLGRRFGDWRFSWSYILGWVAMLMTFFAGEKRKKKEYRLWNPHSSSKVQKRSTWNVSSVAGIFYICAYRECECRRGNGPH